MQLKHPEILYFLFLLLIPILVHLFQLRKFKTEYFTNVKFLKELAIQTRKSAKLKKYLLLTTRLLLLGFLIFAFSQPFLKAKDGKNATTELYLILDNSFSMQAKGKKGELLKRAVQDLLEQTPENVNFSLLTCSDVFWNTDIKSIQRELQNLKYSPIPFRVDNLISKIKAHKSVFNKDIVVITDAVEIESNQLAKLKNSENLYFIIPKAEKTDNISIDSVYIGQNLPNFYEISVKIKAFGNDFKDVPIALYNGTNLIAKTLINFESNSKTINFTIPKSEFKGCVSITDNCLEFDNNYFFNISKPEKSNVISIGDIEKSAFLARIYTTDEFNYNNSVLQALDYNLIEKQDAIVLNELKEIPIALQTTLKSFVEKGGNLILIPSSDCAISNLNSFLSNFGLTQFKTLNANEKTISKINFSHPLYGNVFEKKIDNFQYPNVKTSFEISNTAPLILGFSDQTPFLSAIQTGVSSVFIFSGSINKMNSNFQNSPIIVPTFFNMAQNAQKSGITSMIIGNSKPFIVKSVLSKDEIITLKNQDENFTPIQQILNGKVKLSFNENPNLSGNFDILKNEQIVENISFNYNRSESDITKPNDVIADDFKKMASVNTLFDTLQTNRSDNQLWKWFVIFALLFLVFEILIQKLVK